MDRKIILVWDFHGEDAEKTAEHHCRHLEEFMVREKMEMLENYVNTTDPIHFMACMTVYEKDIPVLRDTLKPHRAFVVE